MQFALQRFKAQGLNILLLYSLVIYSVRFFIFIIKVGPNVLSLVVIIDYLRNFFMKEVIFGFYLLSYLYGIATLKEA